MATPRVHTVRHLIAATATATVVATAGIIGISTPVALAHDVVIGGNPANEESLEQFPEVVELEFSGYVQDSFNNLAISDVASDEVLFTGEPTVDGRMVRLDVPAEIDPGEGEYRIGFQITSSDGHSTRGMTTFTVGGGSAPGTAPTGQADIASEEEAEEDSAEDSNNPLDMVDGPLTWVLGGVGILALLGVIIMVIARGKNSQ